MTKHTPLRVCVVCRALRPKPDLLAMKKMGPRRIVWSGGAQRPGRGVYVCRSTTCVERLLKDRRYRRQFTEAMEEECVEQLCAVLALARASGACPQGAEEGRP